MQVLETTMSESQANDSSRQSPDYAWLFDELEISPEPGSTMHFRDLVEVSDALMAGYLRFARQGMSREMVGLAMLGAAINLYEIFDMRAGLPQLLRSMANRIEKIDFEPNESANG